MKKLLSMLCALLSAMPLAASAAAPWLVGAIAGAGAIAGFSIYRSVAPVNTADAMAFFSSCWSCQMFSDIMATMSALIPRAYHAIGTVTIPLCVALTALWFAWKLFSGYIGSKTKIEEPWSLAETFGIHLIKLGVVAALLAAPLPRILTDVVIGPVFNIGLSLNRVVAGDEKFNECVIATALNEQVRLDPDGAYAPKLRHNLACELASVHQMTAIGMTTGWTMLNMSFNAEYMHKFLWGVPFFPNIPVFLGGLLVLALFFWALLPVPLYLLEVFIKLSMDLIMMPLMLLSWLFKDWKIFPQNSAGTIKGIIDDVVKGTVGIALIGVFVTFAVMFLNAVFGFVDGGLSAALSAGDSKYIMDGLILHNDGLITVIMMGLFIAMFMTMIPKLITELFGVKISDETYKTVTGNIKTIYGNVKKWWSGVTKAGGK